MNVYLKSLKVLKWPISCHNNMIDPIHPSIHSWLVSCDLYFYFHNNAQLHNALLQLSWRKKIYEIAFLQYLHEKCLRNFWCVTHALLLCCMQRKLFFLSNNFLVHCLACVYDTLVNFVLVTAHFYITLFTNIHLFHISTLWEKPRIALKKSVSSLVPICERQMSWVGDQFLILWYAFMQNNVELKWMISLSCGRLRSVVFRKSSS